MEDERRALHALDIACYATDPIFSHRRLLDRLCTDGVLHTHGGERIRHCNLDAQSYMG
jgi:hypothetical protein